MLDFLRQDEPDEVYKALVESLRVSIVPTVMIACTIALIGSYLSLRCQLPLIQLPTIVGAVSSLIRVGLILRETEENGRSSLESVRRFERLFNLTTYATASSVGALTALAFTSSDATLHLVAVTLLFGYSAGIVARLSCRPRSCLVGVALAAGPAVVGTLLHGGESHYYIATMMAAFALAAAESILLVYRRTRDALMVHLELSHQARRDALTGLLNRRGLREAFEALPRSSTRLIAVHAFDLDGFKTVNDRHGHAEGDALLRKLSDRIRGLVGPEDIAARIGGDEFVLIQPNLHGREGAEFLARRAHATLTEPYALKPDPETRVGLSLGFCVAPLAGADLERMLRMADAASYQAKREGGGLRRAAVGG